MKEISAIKPLRIASVKAHVYRAPIDEPIQTSFGTMLDRPALVVRIEDVEGVVGWGEVWCNFPSVGAEHRARILESVIPPILLEREWASPTEAFATLSKRLHILGIQSGEPGTIAQIIAGTDIALWDIASKKLGQPLWQVFGGTPLIQTYASGLSPNNPEKLVKQKWAEGYRAFKLKVGFGTQKDARNLETLRALLGPDVPIMVDANQAWSVTSALEHILDLRAFNPFWIEEPIAADQPIGNWIELATRVSHWPLVKICVVIRNLMKPSTAAPLQCCNPTLGNGEVLADALNWPNGSPPKASSFVRTGLVGASVYSPRCI